MNAKPVSDGLLHTLATPNHHTNTPTPRLLRRREVEALTGLGRSTIYEMMSKGLFPRAFKLTGKAVGWTESSIAAWIQSREQT